MIITSIYSITKELKVTKIVIIQIYVGIGDIITAITVNLWAVLTRPGLMLKPKHHSMIDNIQVLVI